MAADGIAYGNRITNFSHSEVDSVVLDAILNTPTYWSRINGMGKSFRFPTVKYNLKYKRTNLGQTFTGVEKLNSSAWDDTLQLNFNHIGYTHPRVKVLLEHLAVENAGKDVDLSGYIDEDAMAEINESLGDLIFGIGAGNNPNGLEKLVDDGTNSSTIGGASRTTYSVLNSTVTASGGTISLSKMGTLWQAITTGTKNPTIGVTTKTIWQFLEELIQPQTRGSYGDQGYGALGLRSKYASTSKAELKGAAGFTVIFYKGMPILADDFATSGVLYFLNEDHLSWHGRTNLPAEFAKEGLSKVKLGKSKNMDLTYKPSDFHGWYSQKDAAMPMQAGLLGRYYVIGQVCTNNPRYHGKLTDILGV